VADTSEVLGDRAIERRGAVDEPSDGCAAPRAVRPEEEGPTFVATVRVRFDDIDRNGHVNNARVVTLLEDGRVQWLEAMQREVATFNEPRVIARLELDYLEPVLFGQPVVVRQTIGRIGVKSYEMFSEGSQAGTPVFSGKSVVVPLEGAGGRGRAITDEERAYLTSYQRCNGL
jgi:acyl-CoA thioester hydrolase